MDTIIRAISVYLILLLIFRISGRRTLASITTFDLVLTLIISEAIQQALIDDDNSFTNAVLLVTTLIGVDIALSFIKDRVPRLARIMDGAPVVIVRDGVLQRDRMSGERVDEADILNAARAHEGLERLAQIKYAVVEQSGGITVVPADDGRGRGSRGGGGDRTRGEASHRDETRADETPGEDGGGAPPAQRRSRRRRRGGRQGGDERQPRGDGEAGESGGARHGRRGRGDAEGQSPE